MIRSAFIGLGSNLGDGKRLLQQAWDSLGEVEEICCKELSSPYLSAPVDMVSRHWFTNAVGRLTTGLAPTELLARLLETEALYGRKRQGGLGYQDRSLDLDLLYFEDVFSDSSELVLPHPRRTERFFVLLPLQELAPDFVDCKTGATINEMVAQLNGRIAKAERKDQEIVKANW